MRLLSDDPLTLVSRLAVPGADPLLQDGPFCGHSKVIVSRYRAYHRRLQKLEKASSQPRVRVIQRIWNVLTWDRSQGNWEVTLPVAFMLGFVALWLIIMTTVVTDPPLPLDPDQREQWSRDRFEEVRQLWDLCPLFMVALLVGLGVAFTIDRPIPAITFFINATGFLVGASVSRRGFRQFMPEGADPWCNEIWLGSPVPATSGWPPIEILAIAFVGGLLAWGWRTWKIDEKIWVDVTEMDAPSPRWHRWRDPSKAMPRRVLFRVIVYTSVAILLSAGALFAVLRWSYRLIHCS